MHLSIPSGRFAGIGARGAKNCAAARQNSAHAGQIERHGLVFKQSTPAFQETDKFVFVMKAPLRTTARMTAFNPGQSPPPVSIPTFIACSSSGE